MIYFLTDCTFCKDSAVFSVIYLVKKVMGVVFVIIPIILIVLIIIDFAKNVVAGKEEDMKKNRDLAIRRALYAVVIFFVPTIVNVFMSIIYKNVDGGSEHAFLECWENAKDLKKVSQCNAEAVSNEIAADIYKKSESDGLIAKIKEEINNNKIDGIPRSDKTGESQNGGSNNDSNSGSNTDSTLPSTINNYTIYTGDSRTNLMCFYNKLAPLGGGSLKDNTKCIVAPGYAYTYFHKTVLKQLENELNSHNDANIVLASWGTNDISPDIYGKADLTYSGTYNSKMYSYDYKYLANKYPNAKFIVVSILYFNESKYGAKKYRLTNDLVDNFNNNMKNNVSGVSNIVYCNITSVLGTNLSSIDGIHHYSPTDNQSILNEINKCI